MERFDFDNVTPVEQGGTGETNAKDAANKFINSLPAGSSTPTDEDFYISQYANGDAQNPVNNEFCRRPLKALWNYIKAKTDAIYAAVSHKHAAGDITSGTLPIGRGGTGLNASPSILINLAATVADSVFKSAPRPGVTGVLPIANGGTGGDTFVKSASISGKVISLNMSDGTTKTLITQDTNTSNWTISKATSGYMKDNTTGFKIVWGTFSAGSSSKLITFPSPFSDKCFAVVPWQYNKEESTNIRDFNTTGFNAYCNGGTPTSQGYIAIGV